MAAITGRLGLAGPVMTRGQMADRTVSPIENERPGLSPDDGFAIGTAQFQRLDPGILSEAIPAFYIGRNREGFWVARDATGKTGGIFLFESSALSFARRSSEPTGCATIYQSEPFELDLENSGNPIVAQVGRLKRLLTALQQRLMPPSTES